MILSGMTPSPEIKERSKACAGGADLPDGIRNAQLRLRPFGKPNVYRNRAYSARASSIVGIPESASFHRVKRSV